MLMCTTPNSRPLLGTYMKEIRLAKKIITTLVKDRIQYPGRLFADTASIAARCGILLLLYAYVFKLNDGVVNGATFAVVAWSMFFLLFFFGIGASRYRAVNYEGRHFRIY